MAANVPSQNLQNISVRFNQLSDDVKKQFLEEQLKILNNDPKTKLLLPPTLLHLLPMRNSHKCNPRKVRLPWP
jgi:hypothetical protein